MSDSITIKLSTESDQVRIQRLAELDSGHAPRGEALLAEVNGRLIAAVGYDGTVVADPFERTAAIVRLLQRQVSGESSRPARRRGWLRRFLPA
jgi:hypothetical protein